LVRELNRIRRRANGPLAGIDNLIRVEPPVGRLLGFSHHAHADADEGAAGFGVLIPQTGVMSEKFLDRTGDCVMRLRVVALEPLSEILVAPITKTVDHARPVKPRTAIVTAGGVRQIELRIEGSVRDRGLRGVGRGGY